MSRHTAAEITANVSAFSDAMRRVAASSRVVGRAFGRVVTMQRERQVMRDHLAVTAAAVYADLGLVPPADSVVRKAPPPPRHVLAHGDTCPMCPGQLFQCTAHVEGVQLHCDVSSFRNYRLDGAA